MTDHTLARADEVLTELVELVETARTLPMSASCVIPRERTLDLLDALREVLPPELVEARRLVAQRDRLLATADEQAEQRRQAAAEEAEAMLAQARTEAHQLVEAARTQQAALVSASGVQQAAVAEAARLTERTQAEAARLTERTQAEADQLRAEAERYAGKLTGDAREYATRTLGELVANLQRLLATAENGRDSLTHGD
jgi:cell division septum initiation protein DivIVA